MVSDFVNLFISIDKQSGRLPIWILNGGERKCISRYSAVPIIAYAYLKG